MIAFTNASNYECKTRVVFMRVINASYIETGYKKKCKYMLLLLKQYFCKGFHTSWLITFALQSKSVIIILRVLLKLQFFPIGDIKLSLIPLSSIKFS